LSSKLTERLTNKQTERRTDESLNEMGLLQVAKQIVGIIILTLLTLAVWLCFIYVQELPAGMKHTAPFSPLPHPSFTGPLEPNTKLHNVKLFGKGKAAGAETVIVDSNGFLWGGTEHGMIIRIDPRTDNLEEFVSVGGRPLGLAFDLNQNLIVAESVKGLLSVNTTTKEIKVLVDSVDEIPVNFADGVDVSQTGVIFFSDATQIAPLFISPENPHDTLASSKLDIVSSLPTGRLLEYDPTSGKARQLLGKLQFANGVAVSHDESYVLVAQTGIYSITKYYLRGEKAGQSEVFAQNLPGFPDGISRGSNETFWVPLFSPRNPLLDFVHPYPRIKDFLIKLPESLQPQPKKYGLILQLDKNGNIISSLHDPKAEFAGIVTSVIEKDNKLYLGSLTSPYVAVYDLQQ